MSVPVTPVIPKDFSPEWAEFVLKDWFVKNERDVNNVKITRIEATLNGEQVLGIIDKLCNPFLDSVDPPLPPVIQCNLLMTSPTPPIKIT